MQLSSIASRLFAVNSSRMVFKKLLVFSVIFIVVRGNDFEKGLKILGMMYDKCVNLPNMYNCVKVQLVKAANKALDLEKFDIIDGVSIVRNSNQSKNSLGRLARYSKFDPTNSNQTDVILFETLKEFVKSRSVSIDVPKLIEEARGRRRINFWPLIAAALIKGGVMALAFKAIAATAGTALIIGKMALALCAIMGLKKLVSGKEEKTTLEIVKHPTYSSSHSYSGGVEEEDHYHRSMSLPEDMLMAEKLLRNPIPLSGARFS